MALSRAAAAAARKAARNRGLQGNRGVDGSLKREREQPYDAALEVQAANDMDEFRQMIIDKDITSKHSKYAEFAEMGEEKLRARHAALEKEIHDLERESLDYQENRGDPRRDLEDLSYLDEAEDTRIERLEQLETEIEMIEDIFDRTNIDYLPIENIEP